MAAKDLYLPWLGRRLDQGRQEELAKIPRPGSNGAQSTAVGRDCLVPTGREQRVAEGLRLGPVKIAVVHCKLATPLLARLVSSIEELAFQAVVLYVDRNADCRPPLW